MKATGIVRKTDQLGRIVIPMELRKKMDIHENDQLEIFVDEDMIILHKFQPDKADKACMITGKVSEENFEFAGGRIVLSPEGVDQLLAEIQPYLQKTTS
ncbi:AbrB/MazE/SpoVT family DNA-binding domain-containing protein [Bacillus sp. B15-48]|uniref:AbrB/MazE/SpoVT family DNA-binding domain-containing protein n=1 Tax=Bacillus sp. B15-48 TaxID=1548601 RepID=UPI00193EF394|nr:AbrB/MazE/SpoVT family DNA-binding domain-containing protein [Bacillus sp. B15-48]